MQQTSVPASPKSNDPVIVLLIDDDPDCRMLIRDAIAHAHAHSEILEAADGHAALAMLADTRTPATRPALMFLDIEMPGMSGQDVLRQIRDDPRYRAVPIVMMTGLSDEAAMREAAAHGANSYTLKPASAEEFIQTVQASANYWLNVHQYPAHHLPVAACRR